MSLVPSRDLVETTTSEQLQSQWDVRPTQHILCSKKRMDYLIKKHPQINNQNMTLRSDHPGSVHTLLSSILSTDMSKTLSNHLNSNMWYVIMCTNIRN